MSFLDCTLIYFCAVLLVLGAFCLILLRARTKKITDYLSKTVWFKKYTIISQRVFLFSEEISLIQRRLKDKPIRELISEFNRLFREDFENLFTVLEPGVHYHVVTHYTDVMQKVVDENKIVLLKEPKLKTKRLIREIKPLVGWKDYRIIKRCFKANPRIERCCDKCRRFEKCKCRKGGICKHTSFKVFYEYDFMLAKKNEE